MPGMKIECNTFISHYGSTTHTWMGMEGREVDSQKKGAQPCCREPESTQRESQLPPASSSLATCRGRASTVARAWLNTALASCRRGQPLPSPLPPSLGWKRVMAPPLCPSLRGGQEVRYSAGCCLGCSLGPLRAFR